MLITKVKVGQVTNLSEARYCAGMGVDFLSFPIALIDPKTYQEITGWVAGPKFGVEVDATSINRIQEYKTYFIEVNVDQLGNCASLENLIVSLDPSEWQNTKPILLLSKRNILYIQLEITSLNDNILGIINDITEDFGILLKPSNNIELDKVLKLKIDGLCFDGDAETKPGLKEYPLSEVLEQLEDNT